MSKRGLSMEQKREKMLQIFAETQDVFQLKDLEKLGVKKGVIAQSIKDVVTSLVDDSLINMEKIGSSNYYWCFPSQKSNQVTQTVNQTTEQLEKLKAKKEELEKRLAELNSAQEEPEETVEQLAKELAELKNVKKELETAISSYKDSDPEVEKKYLNEAEEGEEAVYRWTDNVVTIRKWVTEKANMETQEFNKQFGLKEDFEDIEI